MTGTLSVDESTSWGAGVFPVSRVRMAGHHRRNKRSRQDPVPGGSGDGLGSWEGRSRSALGYTPLPSRFDFWFLSDMGPSGSVDVPRRGRF